MTENQTDAVLSEDETYRYSLTRSWDPDADVLGWIMLNPSTADATEDDPTIRRCIGYAKEWGYGGIVVGNLFALRSPDPAKLSEHPEPIGPENDAHLKRIAEEAETVVAAWGTKGTLDGRDREVIDLLDTELLALNKTKNDHPNHPLYQPKDADLEPLLQSDEEGS